MVAWDSELAVSNFKSKLLHTAYILRVKKMRKAGKVLYDGVLGPVTKKIVFSKYDF